jgi:hypothetical protein
MVIFSMFILSILLLENHMETKHKITIPKPCHEDWNKMTPDKTGRFCNSCSKSVVDFTQMQANEIQDFFILNQNKSICGRFKNSQLDEIIIQIPSRVLYSQINYHKMFMLALFICMGTTLFSCKQENGVKQKIDKVEIVEDTSKFEKISVGDTKYNPNDSTHISPPPPPTKEDHIRFVKPNSKTKEGKIKHSKTSKFNCEKTSVPDSIVEGEIIMMGAVMESKPEYPGGINKFYQFFIKEFKRPEEVESSKKRILVSFIVEKDGSLSSFEFPEDTNPQISAEITRVLKESPKWQSGEQNRKKIRAKYSLPISFQ